MAQQDKGPRDLVQVRLRRPVYEEMKELAPHRMMGPYVADLTALYRGQPELVTDWHSVGALPTTRAIYDAAFAEAKRLRMPFEVLVSTLIAEGLHRPELLEETPAGGQGELPIESVQTRQEEQPRADKKVA